MSYRDCELNPELACYLLTVMRKAFQNFACGQSSFNENILKNGDIEFRNSFGNVLCFQRSNEEGIIIVIINSSDKEETAIFN